MWEVVSYAASVIASLSKWAWDGITNNLASMASTLFATYVGAKLAFVFERRERVKDVDEKNIAAINRALYTLTEMWTILRQYQRDHLEDYRDAPDRWLNLTSHPLAAKHYDLHFELGQLTFLLPEEGNTLAKVMLQERRFQLAIGLIEYRTKIMLKEVFPRMGQAQSAPGQQPSLVQIEQILGISTVQQLRQVTDQIFAFIDVDIPDLQAVYREFWNAGKRLYPKAKIIRFDFNPPPREPAQRPI
jgi:hypothetical protein